MDSIYKILESLDQVSENKESGVKITNIQWKDPDAKLPGSLKLNITAPSGSSNEQIYDRIHAELKDEYGEADDFDFQFEESLEEGQHDGKSREELLKMKAKAEADIKNFQAKGGSDPTGKFLDDTAMMQMQQHLDSINDALKKVGESVKEAMEDEDGASADDIASAITRRMMAHPKFGALVREIDIIDLNDAIEDIAQFHKGGDLGTSDVSNMVNDVLKQLGKPDALKEEDIEEDNAFNTAAAEAAKAGKKEFEFNGKTYPVKMDQKTAHSITDDVNEDYDKDEYDEEGEMAKNQLDVACDATKELKAMIEDDENLPEWVQKKITLAMDYLDTARDYLKSVEDDMDSKDEVEFELEEGQLDEKAVSRDQQEAAGAALSAKRGETPVSKLVGASKEMYNSMTEKELEDFAGTKHKGLPEKVKKKKTESTVAGAVAVGADATGSNIYGNPSVYESMNSAVESMITESMNVSVNSSNDPSAEPSVTVSATGEDAMALAQLLQLAAVDKPQTMKVCKNCGDELGKPMHMDCPYDSMDPMGENFMEVACEAEEANSADNTHTYDMKYLLDTISGGLNGQKRQINPNNPGDNPMAMSAEKVVNIEESEDVSASHLETLYKEFKAK